MSNEAGKGSARRPTDEKSYQSNFDRIFGKQKPRPEFLAMGTEPAVLVVLPEGSRKAANEDES